MTDLRCIAPDATARLIEAEGVDLCSLLFAWLDGCLAAYGADYFIGRRVAVTGWGKSDNGDGRWHIRAVCYGEIFEFGRHSQGTEVKAMTYSNMQIFDADGIVHSANDAVDKAAADAKIVADAHAASAAVEAEAENAADAAGAPRAGLRKGRVDVYVIVDI